jgi:hypothetical protein
MANESGSDSVSVPLHKPIKVGTLSRILKDLSAGTGLSIEELLSRLEL